MNVTKINQFIFLKGYLVKKIENIFSVFLQSYGNTCGSLGETRNCAKFPRNFSLNAFDTTGPPKINTGTGTFPSFVRHTAEQKKILQLFIVGKPEGKPICGLNFLAIRSVPMLNQCGKRPLP